MTTMPKIRPWPARWPIGKRPIVDRYELNDGETFKKGDPVKKDGSDKIVEVSGSDPTPLLGFAAEDAASAIEPGYVVVYTADNEEVWFAMNGSRAPVSGDIGQNYGIAEDSDGIWHVDATDTSNPRVEVMDIDVSRELWLVKILSAHRQSA